MIEHRALVTSLGISLRERRGIPGLARWNSRGQVPPNALDRLDAWSARSARLRLGLTVYVGSSLCRITILPTVKGVKSFREYDAVASHWFADQLGLSSARWVVRTDPGSPLGVVACAVQRDTLELAGAIANRLAQPLRSIQPWTASALARPWGARKRASPPVLLHETDYVLALATDALGNTRLVGLPPAGKAANLLGLLGIEAVRPRQLYARPEPAEGAPLRGDFCDLLVERAQ